MASIGNVLMCAALAVAIWTLIGLPIAARVAPPTLAWLLAPAIGWSVHSVLALPLFSLTGMSRPAVLTVMALSAAGAGALVFAQRASIVPARPAGLVLIGLLAAALLALGPMAALIPKVTPDGVVLAHAIFDHSKIAMVDEMVRSGVPAANPFFSEIGTPDHLTYYYLWHFSAAVMAAMTGVSGWEADGALTWFTGFASLSMMIGFATRISGRASTSIWVVALAATASLRLIINWLAGSSAAYAWIGGASGFGGWLFQISWAPQHVASAMAVVLACYLLCRLASERSAMLVIVFGLVAAAAFESSVWVGGLVFAIAAAMIGCAARVTMEPRRRVTFLLDGAIAAGIALAFSSLFIYDQMQTVALRDSGVQIAITPVDVLGERFPASIRRILDLPAYWLVYLPLEFPAFYAAGMAMLALLVRRPLADSRQSEVRAFALLLAASLTVAWLLASVIGDNNDLGWRAVLPGAMLLIVFAAAGLSHWISTGARGATALALGGLLLGLPEGVYVISQNIRPEPDKPALSFAAAPDMWAAVRRHMTPQERVANNPLFLDALTPWPVNISWALLADRRSCYAGAELALPFAPLSTARRNAVEAQFIRIFEGKPQPGDIAQLVERYRCDLIVVTAQDGAWANDPFAPGPFYRLAEMKPGAWRIYRRAAP